MRPEILAPAGSMDALRAAVHAGADAVYLGGDQFGARAYASNFDRTALIDAIEYCHLYGVKVYLTINTLFRNEEINELRDYLTPLYTAGLDAVIVQDLGVVEYVHSIFPDLPIHASTQMTITTKYAYELLRNYGVTRIVPARELSIEEITSLKGDDHTPEIEVFVQGALCYCYSGQCLMSSMLGGRSGNRGRCAQTCRLPYSLYNEQEEQMDTNGEYLLSPKDLCGLESIPDLIRAGVDSFKIEGRMKRPEYVAACVLAYRKALDAWYEGKISSQLVNQCKAEMAEVFNRGFTNGYYHQKNGKNMMSIVHSGNAGVVVGTIVSIHKNQVAIQLEKNIHKGDVLTPEGMKDSVTLTSNVEGCAGETIFLNVPKSQQFYQGQLMNRMSNSALMGKLQSYVTDEKTIHITGFLYLKTGKSATLTLNTVIKGKEYSCQCEGDLVEQASTKPLTEATVIDKIGKTGNTRYSFDALTIDMSNDAFYSLKALKDLRRNAITMLEHSILAFSRRNELGLSEEVFTVSQSVVSSLQSGSNSVMISSKEQYDVAKQYGCFDYFYLDSQYFDYNNLKEMLACNNGQKLAVVLPSIVRLHYQQEIESLIAFIQNQCTDIAIMVRNIDELAMLKHCDFQGEVISDYSLYTMNNWSANFIRSVFPDAKLTVPVELNKHQMKKLDYVNYNSEIIVYGYQQLMVSAQCLQSTSHCCTHSNAHFIMKDRYFKNFFIFSICKYCYNLIYNGIPTVLYDLVERDFGEKISKRFHFTKESRDEMSAVLEAYLHGEIPDTEKTRGHYKRGVE